MEYTQHSLLLDKQRDPLVFADERVGYAAMEPNRMRNRVETLVCAARKIARQQKLSAAIIFGAKALRNPRATADWIEFVNTHHAHYGANAPDPRALRKPLRNYCFIGRSVAQRSDALKAHYTFVASKLLPSSHRELLNLGKIRLARLHAKGADFDVWLSSSILCGQKQEGELTLRLTDSSGRSLARLAFSCDGDLNGQPTLIIGGLQGLRASDDKKIIVEATRTLSGLRPKDAVLVATHALARTFGIERVLAVSNHTHVLATERFSKSVISRDYDGFWAERGGVEYPLVGYQLPATDYAQRVASSRSPRLVDRHRAELAQQVGQSLAAIS